MNEVPLSQLQPGAKGTIVRITSADPQLRQRLLEMGLTKGTVLEVIRLAPLGDPLEISVRGYRLSLRKHEATSVLVKAAE